jgi:hypothetical protein
MKASVLGLDLRLGWLDALGLAFLTVAVVLSLLAIAGRRRP